MPLYYYKGFFSYAQHHLPITNKICFKSKPLQDLKHLQSVYNTVHGGKMMMCETSLSFALWYIWSHTPTSKLSFFLPAKQPDDLEPDLVKGSVSVTTWGRSPLLPADAVEGFRHEICLPSVRLCHLHVWLTATCEAQFSILVRVCAPSPFVCGSRGRW